MNWEICEARIPPAMNQCDGVAVALYRYACLHDHIAVRATCEEHRPIPNAVGCIACWDADTGHDCPMVFAEVKATDPIYRELLKGHAVVDSRYRDRSLQT